MNNDDRRDSVPHDPYMDGPEPDDNRRDSARRECGECPDCREDIGCQQKVSAVADERRERYAEQGCGCDSHTSSEACEGPVWVVLRSLREDNARLRAELETANRALASTARKLAAERTTIERVSAVQRELESEGVFITAARLGAALEGDTNA